MSVQSFLHWYTSHLAPIIEWVAVGILLLTTYITYRLAKGEGKEEVLPGVGNSSELQKALKQLIESQTQQTKTQRSSSDFPQAKPADAEGDAVERLQDVSQLVTQTPESSEKLKEVIENLTQKEVEIAALKSQLAEATTAQDTSQLEAKIKELEAKLSDYEIIEDDIADLSLFKEENERLRSEVEELKSKLETNQDEASEIDSVTSLEEILAAEPTEEMTEQGPKESSNEASDTSTDDLMAGIEKAIAAEKKITPEAEKPALQDEQALDAALDSAIDEFAEKINGIKAQQEPAVTEVSASGGPEESLSLEDIEGLAISAINELRTEPEVPVTEIDPFEAAQQSLAQSEAVSNESESESELSFKVESDNTQSSPAEEEGPGDAQETASSESTSTEASFDFDTEKMMAEMSGLEAFAGVSEAESSLDEDLNTDKMLDEVADLNSFDNQETKS